MSDKLSDKPTVPLVYGAISNITADLAKTGVGKNDTNAFDKYKFRGIDAVYNALAPLLSKHGLVVLPRITERICEERTSKNGGAMFYVTVRAELDFISSVDASTHTVVVYGEAMDRSDKATNKAMTAAYKYAMFEAFCIPVVGTDDADAETPELDSKKPEKLKAKVSKPTRSDNVPINEEQVANLLSLLTRAGGTQEDFLEKQGLEKITDLTRDDYMKHAGNIQAYILKQQHKGGGQ